MGDHSFDDLFRARSALEMIELRNVTHAFNGKGQRQFIVKNGSMVFPKGEAVGLLGRNGAGKSTLLKMIAGNINPQKGDIFRNGSVSFPVGFSGSFHRDMTGTQNVKFVARIYGVDTDYLVEFVTEFADLAGRMNRPVRNFSSGMKSRLAFAISMGIQFDVYLVDEVTSVGDRAFKRKSAEILRERLKESSAIVVSHSLGEIEELCSSAAILENGDLQYFENVAEAISVHKEMMDKE